MILSSNIHPITDFTRKTDEYIQRLKETGNAEVLTVNGHAELVVQSKEAYQKLLDLVELARVLPILQESLAQAKRGEGRSAETVIREISASARVELD